MRNPQRSLIAASVLALLVTSGAALAAGEYIQGSVYVAGDPVCLAGDLYRAKWWAGPEDRPSDVDLVANPWETPWARIEHDSGECAGGVPGNSAPVVTASATAAPLDPLGNTPVELMADATDADGDALTFTWTQIPGSAPSVTIQGADQPVASVLLPEATQTLTYRFRVTVSDGAESVSDELEVTLTPRAGNQAPLASASAAVSERIGAGRVQLSALASSDPDGAPASTSGSRSRPPRPWPCSTTRAPPCRW